jgi:TolB protein
MLISMLAGSETSSAAARKDARLPIFALAAEPAWSPDRSRIAFVAARTPGDQSSRALYVMNADGKGVRRLTTEGFDARWPSWSPDGRSIVFAHKATGRTGSDV